jgi:hypothetical protein
MFDPQGILKLRTSHLESIALQSAITLTIDGPDGIPSGSGAKA